MRTAITVAIGHDGKATILFGPEIGLDEQARSFKALPREASDPKHQEVQLWQSDVGIVKNWTYRSPVDLKALEEKQARDQKTFEEAEAARQGKPSRINAPLENPRATPPPVPPVEHDEEDDDDHKHAKHKKK